MYQNIKVSEDKQRDIILHIKETKSFYKTQLTPRHEKLLDIYTTVTNFKQPYDEKRKWATRFLVNKSHEIINKVHPKIIARSPKWIVSYRAEHFDADDAQLEEDELIQKRQVYEEATNAIQDYLTYTFDKYNLTKVAKLWAKKDITYGDAFAKVEYKYEIGRVDENIDNITQDELGNEIITPSKTVKEDVIAEYPTMVIPSWTDILYDPRYMFIEDMASIIENKLGVRMSYFTKNKKKYFNIDKLMELGLCKDYTTFKNRVFALSGIRLQDGDSQMKWDDLQVTYYYGLYDMKEDNHGEGEKLYEFCVVNDVVLVAAKEIAQIPYEQIKCFEDSETNFGTGFVEPIMSLQDELNFKKNNAADYILKNTYRSFIWSPNSGINPKQLVDKPNNIIQTDKPAQEALANLIELPQRSIDPSYFNEQNDFERQIQGLSFTVDTSNPRQDNQTMNDTATGIKVKYYENNAVIDEVRKSFEAGLERIAYKLLQCAYDNMTDNIVIKRLGDEGFWEMNKELFRDALRRYEIKIETGSSSYDTMEQKRNDAMARIQVAQQMLQAGVPVNMLENYKDFLGTFEKPNVDKYIQKQEQIQQPLGGMGQPQDMAQNQPQQAGYQSLGSIPPM